MARLQAAGPNAAQIEFWNGPTGESWVELADSQDRMLASLGAAAIEAAAIAPGQTVLDIGCGCGSTTLALARLVGPTGHVLGIDISTPMLERARQQAAREPELRVAFENHDAATYAFAPRSFDRVYSRFGVMFFSAPMAAFANIRAGVKPGGQLAFVCWQPLARNPWMEIAIEVPSRYLERPPPPGPEDPGPFAFREPDRVTRILAGAGFSEIDIVPRFGPVPLEADVERSAAKLARQGPMSQPLTHAPADLRARILTELAEALEPYATPGGVMIDSAAWIVTARAA